jgi:A/G-specific adenine glycosylase
MRQKKGVTARRPERNPEGHALLHWYRLHRRDLPWRRTTDPWAIWVSEVMLQQTRVEHVVAYFEAFLARFPTPLALASASIEEVLARWSGLGYYRRARALHRAAAIVAEGGGIPTTAARLRELPGIGDYTAAAVASIAFGEVVPVLDGNVARVLSRRLGLEGEATRPAVARTLRAAAAQRLDPTAPGDSNQALMELGARVCTPRAPRCGECPIGDGCVARRTGDPERFPSVGTRAVVRRVPLVVAIVERDGAVLLFRRDQDASLLAGTWELPWAEGGARGAAARLGRRYGGVFRLGRVVGRARHAITTRRIEATVREASYAGDGVGEGREARWVRRDEVANLPTSSLVGKALSLRGPTVSRRRG